MLPDAYGLLGQARREEGDVAGAEALLREAVRLAPEDPVQTARLADLLMAIARVDHERQRALQEEVRELLDAVVKGDRKAPEVYVLLATLAREQQGDADRAAWLLKRARKQSERGADRSDAIAIEEALVDMAQGRVQEAEAALRKLTSRDPTNHRAFAALGHVLEAMDLYVPAHAEYLRAKERAPKNSLDAQAYDMHIQRVQAVIEAQAAGLYASSEPAEAPSAEVAGEPHPAHQRVIRRPRAEGMPDEEDDPATARPDEA